MLELLAEVLLLQSFAIFFIVADQDCLCGRPYAFGQILVLKAVYLDGSVSYDAGFDIRVFIVRLEVLMCG